MTIEISDKKNTYCHDKANTNIDLIEAFLITDVFKNIENRDKYAQEMAHSLYDQLYRMELMELPEPHKKQRID